MNKQTLIWTLVIAVPVGIAALVTGYVYRGADDVPVQSSGDTSAPQASSKSGETPKTATAPETAETPANVAAPKETAAADEKPADAEATTAVPSFDVVGVEPTGETVVAGRSDAGAIVALLANGQIVGKTVANQDGEWTIILNEPLKPGDYDVALEIQDQSGQTIAGSEQRVAVSISDDGKEQPLIVLNTPDGPSDILQKPEDPKVVAEAPKVAPVETAETAPKVEEPKVAEETVVASAPTAESGETGSASGTSSSSAEVKTEEAPVAEKAAQKGDAKTASAPAAPAETPTGTDQATQVAEVAPKEEPTATSAATADQTTEKQTNAQTGQTASAQNKTAEGTETEGTPSVTVEAVETEKGKVYVAGTAEPGSSVRVYVGEDYQGEAKANTDGKWLVEGNKTVAEGNVEVRADKIGEDGSSVDARAAVVFEKEKDRQIVLTKVVASGEGGSPDAQGAEVKKSLPVVIIRKGDNLWRISRRLYGDGVRYTTIYQANKGQIRNPDLIYPGQVFLTPEGDLNWPKPDGENG